MYAIIKGRGQDNTTLIVVSEQGLRRRALKFPEAYGGFTQFGDEAFLVTNPEPEDWPADLAVLTRLDILVPKLVDGVWTLD